MDDEREVVVAGAGPAGCATAILLRRAGHDVLLLDAARFPRDKVCGESLSPEAWPALDELGAGDAVRALQPQGIRGMRLTAPSGRGFAGAYGGGTRQGLALRRMDLDLALLDAARRAGVDVLERARVVDVLRAGAGLSGVRIEIDGQIRNLRARLVVGAEGRRSVVARRLGLLREHRSLRKFAVRSYWDGVQGLGAWGELHVARRGYCGLAPLSEQRANLTFVVDRADMQAAAPGGLERFFRETLSSQWPALAERLQSARLRSPPRALGPLALESRGASAPGALLVGDAAGFFDPFTGEGVTLALRGAAWAAQAGHRALSRSDPAALREYDQVRQAATREKFQFNRLLYQTIAWPALADLVARGMAGHQALADRLVSLAGDYQPARGRLGLGLASRLLLG